MCNAITLHVHDCGHGYLNSFNSTEVYIFNPHDTLPSSPDQGTEVA